MSPSINVFIGEVNPNTVLGMPSWATWVIIGILLIISGLFSASENAFSNCNKYHFRVLADDGKITAKVILHLIEKYDKTLISVLVSNNIVQTFMSFLSAILFYNICQKYGLGNGLEAIFSTVAMGFLVYIVSDTVPKIVSKAMPNKMCYVVAYPVTFMYYLLWPLNFLFNLLLKGFYRLFKIKDKNTLTKEEFISKLDEAVVDEDVDVLEGEEQEELFEQNEINIIKRAFLFDSISVESVLTSKEKMYSLNVDELTYENINKVFNETKFSRIPVYEDNKDNIIGILVIKNYYRSYFQDPHLNIRSELLEPVFVEKSAKVDDIFRIFNKEKIHIAIVKDGDELVGMITMEDILEELVGKINENKIVNKGGKSHA